MIARVLQAALVAGFLAACVATTLQFFLTTPLILQAETYEKGILPEPTSADAADDALRPSHGHDASSKAAAPEEGFSRVAFTGLATLVSGVGYALILLALILAAGHKLSIGAAVRWAIGSFVAVNLAPAVGLPPELPGMGGEQLVARQIWWLYTVLGTGIGLYLIAVVRTRTTIGLGVLVIILPHLIGAPHAVAAVSEVPAMLASQFAVRSLAVAFAFWATLGATLGWAGGALGVSQTETPSRLELNGAL